MVLQVTIYTESVPERERSSMYSNVASGTISGIQGLIIQVEADVSDGLPNFHMVGYLANEIRESGERIRTAVRNAGFELQPKRIIVNLSPADVRKGGSGFDLPIAVAILVSYGYLSQESVEHAVFVGELGLDGTILPVNGILSIADCARQCGFRRIFLAKENVREGSMVHGLQIIGIGHLSEAVEILKTGTVKTVSGEPVQEDEEKESEVYDFKNLKGQGVARRALEIAASGMHNVLMSGPPGSGKTMAARCLTGILPPLEFEESMELTKIYSVRGMLGDRKEIIRKRPFRAPHHTITTTSLIGGGVIPKPGEVSLAHTGVLFLDELPEFGKATIEAMRQPLEEKSVLIGRLNATYRFPANIMLIGAMNPCPCGAYPDRRYCNCTISQVRAYQGKISRAMLDRMDILLRLQPVSFEAMNDKTPCESSTQIRNRVIQAHKLQQERYQGTSIRFNSQLNQEKLHIYCKLTAEEEDFMKEVFERKHLSGRGYHRILRVARTIADMEASEAIEMPHLTEAVAYRMNLPEGEDL